MPTGRCYFCDGRAESPGDAVHCTRCGTLMHVSCGKKKELAQETSGGLLSSGGIEAKCPECGHTGST